MKTSELDFLKNLQNTLQNQETDSQAAPRFWVIRDYRYEPTAVDYADRTVIFMPSHDDAYPIEDIYDICASEEIFTQDELIEIQSEVKNNEIELLKDRIKVHIDEDARLVDQARKDFIVPDTLFLTKKEAQDHLKYKGYRYSKNAHTYAMTALDSPNVEKLWSLLETNNWDVPERAFNRESKEFDEQSLYEKVQAKTLTTRQVIDLYREINHNIQKRQNIEEEYNLIEKRIEKIEHDYQKDITEAKERFEHIKSRQTEFETEERMLRLFESYIIEPSDE